MPGLFAPAEINGARSWTAACQQPARRHRAADGRERRDRGRHRLATASARRALASPADVMQQMVGILIRQNVTRAAQAARHAGRCSRRTRLARVHRFPEREAGDRRRRRRRDRGAAEAEALRAHAGTVRGLPVRARAAAAAADPDHAHRHQDYRRRAEAGRQQRAARETRRHLRSEHGQPGSARAHDRRQLRERHAADREPRRRKTCSRSMPARNTGAEFPAAECRQFDR